MNTQSLNPLSSTQAEERVARIHLENVANMDRQYLVLAWAALAYLDPGFHPDGALEADSGWPEIFKPLVREVFERHEKGLISDDELYPADAQWLGLCDQIKNPSIEEINRMAELRKSVA